jgi:hypothetical protein
VRRTASLPTLHAPFSMDQETKDPMATPINIERGLRFIKTLPNDETARIEAFRALVRDASELEWAMDTAVAVYHLAGYGNWAVDLHDLNMITTALEENLGLLPLVREDVERVFHNVDSLERRTRSTWDYVLGKSCARTKTTAA